MDTTKIRVLIADDHPVVRAGLRALLESEPDMAVVGETATGAEAVAHINELRPDVVIMDISMPTNGIDATRQRYVAKIKGNSISPNWAPDGGSIAFTSFQSRFPEIYTVNSGGGVLKQLTHN